MLQSRRKTKEVSLQGLTSFIYTLTKGDFKLFMKLIKVRNKYHSH